MNLGAYIVPQTFPPEDRESPYLSNINESSPGKEWKLPKSIKLSFGM